MFISDESNNAIRKLDSEMGVISTVAQSREHLKIVRGMTQDNLGNLFVTFNDGITKVSIESGITEILVGSTTAEGFRDGPFAFVQFDDPRDVVMINDSALVVADDGNHRLRVLDLITNTSSSICVGRWGYGDGNLKNCTISDPNAVAVIGKNLFVGGWKQMRKVNCKFYV